MRKGTRMCTSASKSWLAEEAALFASKVEIATACGVCQVASLVSRHFRHFA